MENLGTEILEFETVGKLLEKIKKELEEEENKESKKIAELKEVEQGLQTMDKYIQIFKKVARGNSYKERLLVEEFKR